MFFSVPNNHIHENSPPLRPLPLATPSPAAHSSLHSLLTNPQRPPATSTVTDNGVAATDIGPNACNPTRAGQILSITTGGVVTFASNPYLAVGDLIMLMDLTGGLGLTNGETYSVKTISGNTATLDTAVTSGGFASTATPYSAAAAVTTAYTDANSTIVGRKTLAGTAVTTGGVVTMSSNGFDGLGGIKAKDDIYFHSGNVAAGSDISSIIGSYQSNHIAPSNVGTLTSAASFTLSKKYQAAVDAVDLTGKLPTDASLQVLRGHPAAFVSTGSNPKAYFTGGHDYNAGDKVVVSEARVAATVGGATLTHPSVGCTQASPSVCTLAGHGLSFGDRLKIAYSTKTGGAFATPPADGDYLIAVPLSANTFSLQYDGMAGAAVDGVVNQPVNGDGATAAVAALGFAKTGAGGLTAGTRYNVKSASLSGVRSIVDTVAYPDAVTGATTAKAAASYVAGTGVITFAAAHGFANGDVIMFTGAAQTNTKLAPGNMFIVGYRSATTIVLKTLGASASFTKLKTGDTAGDLKFALVPKIEMGLEKSVKGQTAASNATGAAANSMEIKVFVQATKSTFEAQIRLLVLPPSLPRNDHERCANQSALCMAKENGAHDPDDNNDKNPETVAWLDSSSMEDSPSAAQHESTPDTGTVGPLQLNGGGGSSSSAAATQETAAKGASGVASGGGDGDGGGDDEPDPGPDVVEAANAGLPPAINFVAPSALDGKIAKVFVVGNGDVLQCSGRGVSIHGVGLSPAQSKELAARLHNAAVGNEPTRMKSAEDESQYMAARALSRHSYSFQNGDASVFNHLVKTMNTDGKIAGSAVLSYMGKGSNDKRATGSHTDGFAPHSMGRILFKTAGWFYINNEYYDCRTGCIIVSHNVRTYLPLLN